MVSTTLFLMMTLAVSASVTLGRTIPSGSNEIPQIAQGPNDSQKLSEYDVIIDTLNAKIDGLTERASHQDELMNSVIDAVESQSISLGILQERLLAVQDALGLDAEADDDKDEGAHTESLMGNDGEGEEPDSSDTEMEEPETKEEVDESQEEEPFEDWDWEDELFDKEEPSLEEEEEEEELLDEEEPFQEEEEEEEELLGEEEPLEEEENEEEEPFEEE